MDRNVWQELMQFTGVVLYGTFTGRAAARRFGRIDLAKVALFAAVAAALILAIAQLQLLALVAHTALPFGEMKVLAILAGAVAINASPITVVAIAFIEKRAKS